MRYKISEYYFMFKEFPDVILFLAIFMRVFFQKSDVKYENKTDDVLNILGNGPSALFTYQGKKENHERLMCVNYFALNKEFFLYKPQYYTLVDPEFFVVKNKKNDKLLASLNEVTWGMELFVPSKYGENFRCVITNKNVKVKVFRVNYLPGNSRLVHWLYQKNMATPKFQNIIIACLYVAINIGIRRINLHGVEANEFTNLKVTHDNEVLLETKHFYGDVVRNMTQEGRIKLGEIWKYLNYYSLMFKGFSQISAYSRVAETRIYNYTKNSYIDVFEKR